VPYGHNFRDAGAQMTDLAAHRPRFNSSRQSSA